MNDLAGVNDLARLKVVAYEAACEEGATAASVLWRVGVWIDERLTSDHPKWEYTAW